MIRRWQVVTIVLSASILVLLFLKLKAPPEPVLKGRTLSSWLDHHVASSAASPSYGSPGWKEAHEAIRNIGTNGIPTLLKMIRARDLPKPLLKLVQEGQRYRWLNLNYRPAISQNEEAEYAFEILSTNAAPAVPKLIEIYERNVSPSSQRCAALALDHIGRAAQAALPALIRNFTHTNRDVRFYAVSAAAKIGGEPSSLIPPLTGALKDSNVDVRWNALVGL